MIVCLARGCKKQVPDAAIKNLDPFCSADCFRSHHRIVLPKSGMYIHPPPSDKPTLLQRVRAEVSRRAMEDVRSITFADARYAHLLEEE